MKHGFKPRELTLLGLLTALILVLFMTPLGYLSIGVLSITFFMIPVAIAAVAIGPLGGLITGTIFGITSILNCLGFGFKPDALGVAVIATDPVLTVIMCLVPRMIAGTTAGFIHKAARKWLGSTFAGFITGFFSALLNTVLFLSALLFFFSDHPFVIELLKMSGIANPITFFVVGSMVNIICEIVASTTITGIISKALEKARLIGR